MEGNSIPVTKKARIDPDPSKLFVDELEVTEVSFDGDSIQNDGMEVLNSSDREDEIEQDDSEEMSQFEIEDHQYISPTDEFQKLKALKQTSTKYIICGPDQIPESCKGVWTRGMTQILIEEYRHMVDEFRDPHKKQKDLWFDLANRMRRKGCDVTWDMCDRKWRNMKHTFKSIYYNKQRSAKSKRRWEFFKDMEELLIAQESDEGMRKSRTISPPASPEPLFAGTSACFGTRPAKRPRILPNSPQVSYAQVLDVSNLQNQIVTYPQIVLCNEANIPLNKKTTTVPLSVPNFKSVLSDSEGPTETPPSWFLELMRQHRIDEERRLAVLKEMHAEVIQMEKRKCLALESLLKKLSS